MVKILVSKCLYGGEIVRYDGGDTTETDPRFLKWKQEGRLVPICSEEDIDDAASYLEEIEAESKG